jgi:hypothetical protein
MRVCGVFHGTSPERFTGARPPPCQNRKQTEKKSAAGLDMNICRVGNLLQETVLDIVSRIPSKQVDQAMIFVFSLDRLVQTEFQKQIRGQYSISRASFKAICAAQEEQLGKQAGVARR